MTANLIELGEGTHGPVRIDLTILMRAGLLIQANSGGGKSKTMRRLAEQLSGKVQTLIVDPEGEFASLREHFPFVLVGKGGDTPAHVSTAATVARKMLELRTSAVFDLFEMRSNDRHAWIAAFMTAMVDAPKTLWHDVVVMVDEAHVYAPEKGHGDSEASEPFAALGSRGRKRGFCTVAATQRLAKFRKDVAAELQNKLIGPTFLPNDRDRAAEELGITRAERKDFDQQIKTLDPGYFWGFGRAISKDRVLVHVGPVKSHHPEPGELKQADPPPPPEKIRHLLAKLGDLPKEVEAKATEERDLKAEIARLRAELAGAGAGGAAEERDRLREELDGEKALSQQLAEDRHLLRGELSGFDGLTPNDVRRLRHKDTFFEKVIGAVDGYRAAGDGKYARNDFSEKVVHVPSTFPVGEPYRPIVPSAVTFTPAPKNGAPKAASSNGLPSGARAMLAALAARHPDTLTRTQVATLSVIAPKGGTFAKYLSVLKGEGHIIVDGDRIGLTPAGLKIAGGPQRRQSAGEVLTLWRDKLPGKCRDMLELLAAEGRPFTKAEIAKRLELDEGGGTFAKYLSILRSNALVQKTRGGFEASPSLVLR